MVKTHRAHHPGADLDVLRRAYELAESSHRGQMRKSGEPYITHPLAVTLILAELGAETTTLTASLLHDTVEDTEVTLAQVREEFGEEVRYLVDGVTKLEKVDYGAAAEPETFRKMLVATGNDVRVMSIKLADRLHNMRTLGVMRPEKQVRIAKVTRDVLIPLAERLGVQALKTELEDLVFAILHPEEYARTRELIAEHAARPDPLAETARSVRAVLHEAGIAADVLVRPRHIVSVYRARLKRGELSGSGLGRLLVLVGEDADCYAVLGELHTCFTPVISEFKDFIAVPKFNLYQSLHTAVAGDAGEITEVLIRTQQMHNAAEAGVVALGNPYAPAPDGAEGTERTATGGGSGTGERHGAGDGADGERADPTRPGWLSRLLDWQRAVSDTDAFWSSLRDDLAQDREITVFALDGTVLSVPDGASCVDAVYARYGAAGHCCVGARVNGRLVTLSTALHDGDGVEFLMASGRDAASSGPSPEWLAHARTPAARIAITHWLNSHQTAPDHPPHPGSDAASSPAAHGGAVTHHATPSDGGERESGAPAPHAAEHGAAPATGEHGAESRVDGEEAGKSGLATLGAVARGAAGRAAAGSGARGAEGGQDKEHGHARPGAPEDGATAHSGARGTGHGARGAADGAPATEHGATGHGARSAEHGARGATDGARAALEETAHSSATADGGGALNAASALLVASPPPIVAPPGAGEAERLPAPTRGGEPHDDDGHGTVPSTGAAPSTGTPPPDNTVAMAKPASHGDRAAPPVGSTPASNAAVATAAQDGAGSDEAEPEASTGGAPKSAVRGRGTVSADRERGIDGRVSAGRRAAGHDGEGDGAEPASGRQRHIATGRRNMSEGKGAASAAAGRAQEPGAHVANGVADSSRAPGSPRTEGTPGGQRGASDARRGPGVVVGQPGVAVRLAGCCTPVPPDEVTGFAVRGGAVTVHRVPCPVVTRMTEEGRESVEVHWQLDAETTTRGYRVTLCAEAFSRPHLLADLTEVIAAQGAEVISAAVEPPYEQRVRHTYTLQLPDAGRLPLLMRAMRQVPSVYDVTRAGHELTTAGV
ncbi:(p)ppGpp synthase/HD superfamily hydrolase [Streptomyces zagrosensis]|uniref:(P)ppGpp synthase/HD superfamily hydrolase n=1 Tax=Streptomyces zagrosensis TaxID=1042984 RepID=A0A7W9V189_9ACTN|nr:(p)ppGpp synthase/HD superfamily hydrolase [Streptomyces zagrosensis]